MRKTIKVNEGTYETLARIAEKNGQDMCEVADAVLGSNLQLLNGAINSLAKEGKIKEVFDGVIQFKNGGLNYVCAKCGHPLDKEDDEDECPWCHSKLDWKLVTEHANKNWGGWVVGGLLILGLLGAFRGQAGQINNL